MDSRQPESLNSFVPLPSVLLSDNAGKPFSNCMVCDKYLLTEGTPYMIEKAIRQIPEMNIKETLFEYAMCMDCAMMMNNSLSVESRQRINNYFATHVDFEARNTDLMKDKATDVESWISTCIVRKTPVAKSAEYQIVAQCDGTNLVLSYAPFALCMETMDEMTALLSEKSLGEIDDFMGKYFTGPPEVSAILKRRLVLI
jgi:hypothetical protein